MDKEADGPLVNPLRETMDRILEKASKTPTTEAPPAPTGQQIRAEEWRKKVWARFSTACLSDLPDMEPKVNAWLKTHDGSNLVVAGDVGTGKTHLAIAACREAYYRYKSVSLWPVVDLLDALRPGDHEFDVTSLINVDFLLLDDLGSERVSDWTVERLFAIINRRWLEARPTIVTTNLTREELVDAVGARTTSRILHGATVLVLGGGDLRLA